MSILTYDRLKSQFDESKSDFSARYCGTALENEAITILARAKYDTAWPLAMLSLIRPQLAEALSFWTARGSTAVRNAQMNGNYDVCPQALSLEREISHLPLWKSSAIHYTKSRALLDKLKLHSIHKLESFMSCCPPGSSFAYVHDPVAVLVFTKLKSARLIGALTEEPHEREVLLPRGASFIVVNDENPHDINLEELAHS